MIKYHVTYHVRLDSRDLNLRLNITWFSLAKQIMIKEDIASIFLECLK